MLKTLGRWLRQVILGTKPSPPLLRKLARRREERGVAKKTKKTPKPKTKPKTRSY